MYTVRSVALKVYECMSVQGPVYFHACKEGWCKSKDGHDREDRHISLNGYGPDILERMQNVCALRN